MKNIIPKLSLLTIILTTLLLAAPMNVLASTRSNSRLTDYEAGYGLGFIDGYWKAARPKTYNSSKSNECRGKDVKLSYYKSKKDGYLGKARKGYAKNKYKNRSGYCTIRINMTNMINQPSWKACLTIVHEYGHLMGLGHSRDKNNIMYWKYDRNNDLIPGCKGSHL